MRRLLLVGSVRPVRAPGRPRGRSDGPSGPRCIVKNPSTPAKRKITVKAKETASDNTLVGDPVANGATVTITANGTTPSSQTYALPAGTAPARQKPFWTGDAVKGFKYSDAKGENGPVKSAQIKLKGGVFQIKVAIDGKLGAGRRRAAESRLGRLRAPHDRRWRFVQRAVRERPGDEQGRRALQGREADRRRLVRADHHDDAPRSSTTTTTLGLPFIPPPGPAPLRYRDLRVRRGDHDQRRDLRQRGRTSRARRSRCGSTSTSPPATP